MVEGWASLSLLTSIRIPLIIREATLETIGKERIESS